MKAESKVWVGILDCDQHYGDGTAEILAALHIDWIRHVPQEHWNPGYVKPFIDNLPEVGARLRRL